MSTCISTAGEYSDHVLDDAYTCTRCLVLDEDAMVAELRQARARLSEVEAERDAAKIELEAWKPVVEAARAYFDEYGWLLAVDRDNLEAMPKLADDPRFKLLAAVDALPPKGGTDG